MIVWEVSPTPMSVNESTTASASERPPTLVFDQSYKPFCQNKKNDGPIGANNRTGAHDRPFRSVALTGNEASKAMATTTRPPHLNRSGSAPLPRAGITQGRSFALRVSR